MSEVMKNIMRFIIPLSFIVLSLGSYSQHFILSEFFAFQKEDVVKLQWTIKEGQTCNDINIERSGKHRNFDKIGEISGVCGSPEQSVTDRFTDSIPLKNRLNYYRLELGSQGYSTAVSVETRFFGDKSYIIQNNPGIDQMTILFSNVDSKNYTFRIFDTRGNFINEYSTTQNRLVLRVNGWAAGIYIFQAVTDTGTAFTGKFSVL